MKERGFGLDTVVGLFLVCIFAACMFLTLASGVGIYQNVSDVMAEQYGQRTILGYVSTRVHQSDEAGMVTLGQLSGTPALILRERGYDTDYLTYIYCCDGYVSELYCAEEQQLLPSDGQRIIAADSLSFSLDGSLLRVECETGGGSAVQYLRLASENGGSL